jgi:hypothetical protein
MKKIAFTALLPLSLALAGSGCVAQAAGDDPADELQGEADHEEQTGQAAEAWYGGHHFGPGAGFGFSAGFGHGFGRGYGAGPGYGLGWGYGADPGFGCSGGPGCGGGNCGGFYGRP